MAVHRVIIQQTNFDGLTYTQGTAVDTLATFKVVCPDFPFKKYPETKEVVTKDFKGSHGVEVYIPGTNKFKDYDIVVPFFYVGTHATMSTDIGNFLKFINGLIGVSDADPVGARLAIYDEYTQIGRKDVKYKSSEFGTWWDVPDYDTEAIADFKVTFHVYDPATDVSLTTAQNGTITGMTWNG